MRIHASVMRGVSVGAEGAEEGAVALRRLSLSGRAGCILSWRARGVPRRRNAAAAGRAAGPVAFWAEAQRPYAIMLARGVYTAAQKGCRVADGVIWDE